MKQKKLWKILLIILCAVLVFALGYVIYVFSAYYRVEADLPLNPDAPQTAAASAVPVGKEQRLVTFNIGFGAYEPDFGFFMDGGTEARAFSEERLNANLSALRAFLEGQDFDFLLMQEVDEDGTRTYHVNERALFADAFSGMWNVWAQNWDCPYLFYPFTQPHGANVSGIMTFSSHPVTSAVRRSLPVEDSVMKIVDLDRCYSVSRIPTANGRELVLFNTHLSAYTSDGTIATEQLSMLLDEMKKEYEAGNYAVCGGDFNKDLPGNSAELFGVNGDAYTWAQPIPAEVFDGFPGTLCVPLDPDHPVPSCRNADGPYTPEQYVVTVDGFLVTENITVSRCGVIDTGFAYSDHNPAELFFTLMP